MLRQALLTAGPVTRVFAACCVCASGLAALAVGARLIQMGGDAPVAIHMDKVASAPALPSITRDAERRVLARAEEADTPLPVILYDRPSNAAAKSSHSAPRLVQGVMEDILYGGANAAPAHLVALALHLFAHKLDLTRDLTMGDPVQLVIEDGPTPVLDYAELNSSRLRRPLRVYRIGPPSLGDGAFVDETGADLRRLLLRTPLDHPRLTSGFGMRLHPLLGYSRMHRGVDFGVPVGTPVLAAGDGRVARAAFASGYGRLVAIAHGAALETRYAHLSAIAPSAVAGAQVRQGEVIGWSGQSGLATGPHLHFEVLSGGEAIDPATAAHMPAPPLTPNQALALAERRAMVKRLMEASPVLACR